MKFAFPVVLFFFVATASFAVVRPTASQEPCLPHINAVVPDEGQVGSLVRVEGTCFGETPGKVLGRGQELHILSESDAIGDYAWHDITIDVSLPPDGIAGPIGIVVITAAGESNEVQFNVWNYSFPPPGGNCTIIPGRILVKAKVDVDISLVAADHGDLVVGKVFEDTDDASDLDRWWIIDIPDGTEMDKIVEYANDDRVEWAETETACYLEEPEQPSPTPSPPPTPSPQPSPAQLPSAGGKP